MVDVEEVRRQLRVVRVEIATRYALYPEETQRLAAQYGRTGGPVTFETVRADFGEEAASAWQALRDAHRKFTTVANDRVMN